MFSKKQRTSSADLEVAKRVEAAVGKLATNLMIADENAIIIYMNDSVTRLLRACEPEIQKDLPNFSVDTILGQPFDVFHKNPAHQRGIVSKMDGLLKTSIAVGDYVFNLLATPLLDGAGKRIGTSVEWIEGMAAGQIAAISRAQAVIEFKLDGTIVNANPNFLNAMGYTLDEIKGRHHHMFVSPDYAQSPAYTEFWATLNRGEYIADEFKRIGKGGKDVWIQASYNPIMGLHGKPMRVVKYATDITAQKLKNADYAGQIEAISKAQAVIEFNLDGTIITANPNFLNTLGYTLDEVKGRHHRMFVEPAEAQSPDYARFWEKLGRGEFDARVYKRIGKGGKEVWIQASYNPIMDMNGKPFKVVKYATDVTRVIQTGTIADEASANVQNVAAAIEEMSASVREISSNMTKSKEAVEGIMNDSRHSTAAADQLTESMKSMENVVKLIGNIAGQVNLLALNATIEAARAGEAGRGFAVVAAEVKNLATQTTKATEEIGQQIQGVQAVAESVAGCVRSISGSANTVSEYVTGVAGAIEEQTAVTKEISGNTQKMARSVEEIAQRIKSLSQTA